MAQTFFNSYPVNAPHMMQVSNDQFQLRNHHWGWPSGTVHVLLLACRGFKTECNGFYMFALARFNHTDFYVEFL